MEFVKDGHINHNDQPARLNSAYLLLYNICYITYMYL